VQSAKVVIDKADPIIRKAVDQCKVTVSYAVEITKLGLDAGDLNDLVSLPKPDIPRNVERTKKENRRRETFDRIQKDAEAAPEWPTERFPVAYGDPAWEDDFGHSGRDTENHYPTMDLDKIKAMPVREITTPDAALYLWAPPHMRHKALDVMAVWGFDYRTHIVWNNRPWSLGASEARSTADWPQGQVPASARSTSASVGD
jgi:hypothetical protein